MVDDHPMTLKAYELFLKNNKNNLVLNIDKARNCDEILSKFLDDKMSYDLVLLDLRIPSDKKGRFDDGEDVAYYLRKKYPQTKLLIHTSMNNKIRISNILKRANPDGFLIKTEITPEVLLLAVESILNGNYFFSDKILKTTSSKKDSIFNSVDYKIVHYLSEGYKMADLTRFIPLSLASIERRKRKLKNKLGIPDGSKQELLLEAKKYGIL